MAGWPGVRRRNLGKDPELGVVSEEDAAMVGGGAQWSSFGKTGGGWRLQCGWFYSDQVGPAERGDEAQAAYFGIEEAP